MEQTAHEQGYTLLLDAVGNAVLQEPSNQEIEGYFISVSPVLDSLLKAKNLYSSSILELAGSDIVLLTESGPVVTSASKVGVKNHFPRLEFLGLDEVAVAGHQLGFFVHLDKLHIVDVSTLGGEPGGARARYLAEAQAYRERASRELLGRLRKIASQGLVPAVTSGSTAIGRTLASALGLTQTSRKGPDYKGIEITAYRSSTGTRVNLFAQVPNWRLSATSGSADLLRRVGYARNDRLQLNCTVTAKSPNSQGLMLRVAESSDTLIEFQTDKPEVSLAVWDLKRLRYRLLEKHRETFWVIADSVVRDGREWFSFKAVEHTSEPSLTRFEYLLRKGEISVDHLIADRNGRVSERGPLFKIHRDAISELFPKRRRYELQ